MRILTAAEADTGSAAAASWLARAGHRPGQRIAVVTPEYASVPDVAAAQAQVLMLVLGALRSGVLPVLVHPLLTATEVEYIRADSQSEALFTVHDLPPDWSLSDRVGTVAVDLPQLPVMRPMHYTSGTTGNPKGVVADLSPAEAAAWWLDEIEHWQFDAADVTLVHSPLCHSAPLRFAIGTLLVGGTVALPGKFDPDIIVTALRELHPTTAFVVPSQLGQLLRQELPPSPYRLLAHAGSSCPPNVKRAAHDWAGADRVVEFLGSTEGQFTSCRGSEWEIRPGTLGRARTGRTLSIGDDGRIWCAGPPFTGWRYWDDPQRTAAAWRDTTAGPAFTVGDLGRLDDGWLFLDGRREDLIISGGVNVYPAEVEAAVSAHPDVNDAAVFAVPDDRWGQQVTCAYVGDVTADVLSEWVGLRLASFKRPKQWLQLTQLPRNSMGKVSRTSLPDQLGL